MELPSGDVGEKTWVERTTENKLYIGNYRLCKESIRNDLNTNKTVNKKLNTIVPRNSTSSCRQESTPTKDFLECQ
ncbi:hypothetical protein J6590_044470 [Homalodisca vitripennis]|nr:hypothetical protein J6590_044470 [Homalodisca vitripennis]